MTQEQMKSIQALEMLRHDAAHILGQAVQELFPDARLGIGPAIKDGFYYDVLFTQPISSDDFERIEKRMHDIIDRDLPIVCETWSRAQAQAYFSKKEEALKLEILEDIPADATITVYTQGDWLDLCRGPHGASTGKVGHAFKLTKLAGAYWRGSRDNVMLQRIYGTAWPSPKELRLYLQRLEEAAQRDHRKIGRELDLFHLQEEAQGSVFWHPKGYVIWRSLEMYLSHRLNEAGYLEIKTPQLLSVQFWEKSGHWSKFRENMFVVPDASPNEDLKTLSQDDHDWLALKPMNCPAHVQVFKNNIRSYRDLPLRFCEFGCCHRYEAHGALHGLMRVRQMTQDDAHIFCTQDQIFEESRAFCTLLMRVYHDLGFSKVSVKLATRPSERAGSDAVWDKAEKKLEEAVHQADLPYDILPGEGAFYGPKLEFHLEDAIGRSWQCGTLQLDFVLPDRLDAFYINSAGEKEHPVMLHRAILGSFERFIGILIENYAGKLPLWMAPLQVVVANISSSTIPYAQEITQKLQARNIRAHCDVRSEKLNYKIREHMLQKVPLMAIVGEKEASDKTIALRRLGDKTQEIISLEDFVEKVFQETLPPHKTSSL